MGFDFSIPAHRSSRAIKDGSFPRILRGQRPVPVRGGSRIVTLFSKSLIIEESEVAMELKKVTVEMNIIGLDKY